MDFSTIEITSKKVRGNNVDFLTIEITSKNVRGNNVDFSAIEIAFKKVRENNMDFLTIEITSKKVRGNNVDLSVIEITPKKKYVKTTWIFRSVKLHQKSTWKRHGNSSKFGLPCIDVISWCARWGLD